MEVIIAIALTIFGVFVSALIMREIKHGEIFAIWLASTIFGLSTVNAIIGIASWIASL